MNRNEFARILAAGTYELLILDVLRDGPSYGYGIVQRIYEQSRQTLRWGEGTVYPVLHRLEKRGWLASQWTGPRNGRQRRYYRLTPQGRKVWRAHHAQWCQFAAAVNAVLGG